MALTIAAGVATGGKSLAAMDLFGGGSGGKTLPNAWKPENTFGTDTADKPLF